MEDKGYYALIKDEAGKHWQEILDIAEVSEEDMLAIDEEDAAGKSSTADSLDKSSRFSSAQIEVYKKYNIGTYNTLWDKVAAMYRRD